MWSKGKSNQKQKPQRGSNNSQKGGNSADEEDAKARRTLNSTRWSHTHIHHAGENKVGRRNSLTTGKPLIAFIPEDGISNELLELEEKLEKEHHRYSLDLKEKVVALLASKQKGQQSRVPTGNKRPTDKDKKKRHIKSKSTTSATESVVSAYLGIPRPFTELQKDIEKRRARKMIDIMNSSKESFVISEKDRRVKFCPQGTLIFHILELKNLAINDTTFIRSLPVSFYCVLCIGPIRRCSKIFNSTTARRIRVDYTAHFSIEIPEWRESPLNRFQLELWSYQDPEMHYIVGSMDIHVYEFLRKNHSIQDSQLWSDGVKVGKIYFEYAFSYGTFGYGHSNHLKNPKNPIMETVSHSMYPRIRLEDGNDLIDKVYRVRMPVQLKLFTYNSLIMELQEAFQKEQQRAKNKKGAGGDNYEPKPIVVQQVSFEDDKPIHCKVHMNIYQRILQADFNDTFGEFVCLGGRKQRLEYLTSIVQGRMKDIHESEAGSYLFQPFSERDATRVQVAYINHPGYLVFPTRVNCTPSVGTPKLNKQDESFQDRFPSLRRGPGYLSMLFGYEKPPPKESYLNDMDAPLYKEIDKLRKRKLRLCRRLRYIFLKILAIFHCIYTFIFPEVRKPPPVPEISLTVPSPEGSTTNIFSYFVKDSKDSGASKLEKLQAQTAALIDIAKNPTEALDESGESSEEDDLAEQSRKSIKKYRSFHQITAEKQMYKQNLRKSLMDGQTTKDDVEHFDKPEPVILPNKDMDKGAKFTGLKGQFK